MRGRLHCLAVFLVLLAAAPANAESVPREPEIFRACEVRPPDSWRAIEKRVCSDAKLLDQLKRTYTLAVRKLDPAHVEVLQDDLNRWPLGTCIWNSDTRDRYTDEDAKKCAEAEVQKRLQFLETILAIPTDPPDAAYRFSRFELALLHNYVGQERGPVEKAYNKIQISLLDHAPVRDDLMDRALKRVIASTLPKSATLADEVSGTPTIQFIDTMLADGFVPSLGNDRYIVDDGCKIRDCSVQGRMVIDMSTGETALATIAAADTLQIWIKACISPQLKDFSLALFRSESDMESDRFAFGSFPRPPVKETITQTPC